MQNFLGESSTSLIIIPKSARIFNCFSGVYPSKYRAKPLQAPLLVSALYFFCKLLPLLPKHLRSTRNVFGAESMADDIDILLFFFLFMRVKPLTLMYSATPAGTRPLISSPCRLFSRTIVDETGKNSMFCTVPKMVRTSFTSPSCVTSKQLSLSAAVWRRSLAAAKMRSG